MEDHIWTLTNRLRWVEKPGQTWAVLEQAGVCGKVFEWREVPEVSEFEAVVETHERAS